MGQTKEHSIIFSARMVKAIFDGRKTQTRRVVPAKALEAAGEPISKIRVGDHLWIREVHALVDALQWPALPYRTDGERWCFYREGFDSPSPPKWRSPIHMPRWASRLTLGVVGVRIEPVQAIRRPDVEAEGIEVDALDEAGAREAFALSWDSFNAKRGYAYASNPLVFAYTFRPLLDG